MWVVNCPVQIDLEKKNRTRIVKGVEKPIKQFFPLNMNAYRNAPHHLLSDVKLRFHEQVSPLVQDLPKMDKIVITYVYYKPTLGKVDTNNVCSIVDKFFCDVLVTCGIIKDDNDSILLGTKFVPGGLDRDNPRVEAWIELSS